MAVSKNILTNIFSNWANLVVSVLIAFFVSPIVVHGLGKEMFGVWVLIVSVTGYFTVLDFGINTAIVRYISKYVAEGDEGQARRIYSTAISVFGIMALTIICLAALFGSYFPKLFGLQHFGNSYIFLVFFLACVDLAFGLLFSVFLGALCGLQEFRYVNGVAIGTNLVKNLLVVFFISRGYSLLTLILLQISAMLFRGACQYLRLRKGYGYLRFRLSAVQRSTLRTIYSYSIYSFIIALCLKVLFYTDSIVIGSLISVKEVTFYAIPSTLLDYVEKFTWAMIAVLIPVISTNDATADRETNASLYSTGTRYVLLVCLPVVLSLFFWGDDFIGVWMGPQFGFRSQYVLRFLLVGYGVAFSQLIAQGILKGTDRHRWLAFILIFEAVGNLGLSLLLARPFGIEGVALGTMVPLLFASVAILVYTCRQLGLSWKRYLLRGYGGPLAGFVMAAVVGKLLGGGATTYPEIFGKSATLTAAFLAVGVPLSLTQEHREVAIFRAKKIFGMANQQ